MANGVYNQIPGANSALQQAIYGKGQADSQILAEALRASSQEDIAETQAQTEQAKAALSAQTQKDVSKERTRRASMQASTQANTALEQAKMEIAQRDRDLEAKKRMQQVGLEFKEAMEEARRKAETDKFSTIMDKQDEWRQENLDLQNKYYKGQNDYRDTLLAIQLKALKSRDEKDNKKLEVLKELFETTKENTEEAKVLNETRKDIKEKVKTTLPSSMKDKIERRIGDWRKEEDSNLRSLSIGTMNEILQDLTGKNLTISNFTNGEEPEGTKIEPRDYLTAKGILEEYKENLDNRDYGFWDWMTDNSAIVKGVTGGQPVEEALKEERAITNKMLNQMETGYQSFRTDLKNDLEDVEKKIRTQEGSIDDKLPTLLDKVGKDSSPDIDQIVNDLLSNNKISSVFKGE